jgi:hypothetical protein
VKLVFGGHHQTLNFATGDKQHHLAISVSEMIPVLLSELHAIPIADSINGNQPDGISIQIDHPTGSRISPEFYVARTV